MNDQNLALAAGLVDGAYVAQGAQELRRRQALVRVLLSQRRLPEEGWDDASIGAFLGQLSMMDSNNFTAAVGGGEREGRVASPLVRARHYGFGHGVGRSGDVAAVQPKAAGSSLLYKLTNRLALHAVQVCGVTRAAAALVLPMATGMTLAMVLLAARAGRPPGARYVIWPRIDQKSCLKAIATAGCTAVVVENARPPAEGGGGGGEGDELRTDVDGIAAAIARVGGPDAVVAVVTTSSCFAPRGCDDLVGVARLCHALGVPHVVNHAYGLQAGALCAALNDACRGPASGMRLDAFVSSTDKNFLVPVGGAIVAAPAGGPTDLVASVARSYPGRASLSPILDLFITLLSLGRAGLVGLLAQRKAVAGRLREGLAALAAAHGERVLVCRHNPISFALSLGVICAAATAVEEPPGGGVASEVTTANGAPSPVAPAGRRGSGDGSSGGAALPAPPSPAPSSSASSSRHTPPAFGPTYLGSMLFSRGVSGTRVVPVGDGGERRSIDGHAFACYGAHADAYPTPYLTVAAAVGMTVGDVDVLLGRLRDTIAQYARQRGRRGAAAAAAGGGGGGGSGGWEGAASPVVAADGSSPVKPDGAACDGGGGGGGR